MLRHAKERSTPAEEAQRRFDLLTKPADTRVIWTAEEKDELAKHIAEARLTNPTVSIMVLVNNAIAALPEERRRTLSGVDNIPWLAVKIRDYYNATYGPDAVAAAKQVRLDNESLTARVRELEALLAAVPDARKMPSSELLAYFGTAVKAETQEAIDAVESKLTDRVAEMLKGHAGISVNVNNNGVNSPVNVKVVAPKQRKKVVIIGGKAEALQTIAKGLKEARLDVVLVHKHMDDAGLKRGNLPDSADWCIVLGETVGKSIRDKVLDHYGSEKTIMCSKNASTALGELLTRIRKPTVN